MTRARKPLINPLRILAANTKLTETELINYELPAYLTLDAVLSNNASDHASHSMTRHLVMLQIVAADRQHKALYDFATKAIKAWLDALVLAYDRNTPPNLLTSARMILKQAIGKWSVVLKQVDIGTLAGAAMRWEEIKGNFVEDVKE